MFLIFKMPLVEFELKKKKIFFVVYLGVHSRFVFAGRCRSHTRVSCRRSFELGFYLSSLFCSLYNSDCLLRLNREVWNTINNCRGIYFQLKKKP